MFVCVLACWTLLTNGKMYCMFLLLHFYRQSISHFIESMCLRQQTWLDYKSPRDRDWKLGSATSKAPLPLSRHYCPSVSVTAIQQRWDITHTHRYTHTHVNLSMCSVTVDILTQEGVIYVTHQKLWKWKKKCKRMKEQKNFELKDSLFFCYN